MTVTIKMCGFRSETDIAHLHDLPVQFAGFILAPSKREVTINTLCKLMLRLPKSVTPVAVMVNPTDEEVEAVIEKAGVTTIQLHGDEAVAWCRSVREKYGSDIHLIKALPAKGEETLTKIADYSRVVDTFLIDTYQRDLRGGTGKTFQWENIPVYQKACQDAGRPFWVAGGLTPENVQALLTCYRPDGVDVSSGIERNGVKAAELMKQFVQRVRTHDENDRSTG